jgi:hypothetical protein
MGREGSQIIKEFVMRYLRVDVYNCGRDCTNGGVSVMQPDRLVVPCEDGNYTEQDVIDYELVVLVLVPSAMASMGYPSKFQQKGDERWLMFGGNFIYSSDSRFGRKYGHQPLAIHDRYEG